VVEERRCSVFGSSGGFAAIVGFGVAVVVTKMTKEASERVKLHRS